MQDNYDRIGGGCMPLYSSKGLSKKNHEIINKHQQYAKIPYQFQEDRKINPHLPSIFHHICKRKHQER
jgi:hypothetical protein